MFAEPNVRSDKGWPSDQIKAMERYTLTLVNITDEGISQFAKDKNDPKATHSIRWSWLIHDSTGVPILDDVGDPWEFREWTSNKTGFQNDGTKAKARARLEALAGRELQDTEITRVPIDKLPGRRVSAIFHMVKRTNAEGNEVLRPAVLTIGAYKDSAPTQKGKDAAGEAPTNGVTVASSASKPTGEPEPEFTFS